MPEKSTSAKKTKAAATPKDIAESYNRFKEFGGKEYTGMGVGRSHKWYYDKGVWHDTKITPDLWSISYAVTKRRAGHAPTGSGASVGTDYHWFILAHQNVEKQNADDYTTAMTGLKFKLAHKRADKQKWNISAKTQRKHLIAFLKEMIAQLEHEGFALEFEVGGTAYSGEALPIVSTFNNGRFDEFEITLNDKNLGLLRRLKSSWKLDLVADKKLIKAIGEAVSAYDSVGAEPNSKKEAVIPN
jgi:hypothetical protein